MQRQARALRRERRQDTDILDDHTVEPGLVQDLHEPDQVLHLRLPCQHICRQVNLPVQDVGLPNRPHDLLCRKIVCVGPGTEPFSAEIDRIGPGAERTFKSLPAACRREKLHPFRDFIHE